MISLTERDGFEIIGTDGLARIGKLTINNKSMVTPNIFPVVHPFKNDLDISDLKKIGAQGIFTNAYIIYQQEALRHEILTKGLHKYLNFDGLIATDSGAFQQYMYKDNPFKINAIEIEAFQENIGSELPVILDTPVQPEDNYDAAKIKIDTTIQRAIDNISRRKNKKCFWFGPVHGSQFPDLLEFSSKTMSKLDFGVYAIGGLVKYFLNYRFDLAIKILLSVKRNIVSNKPLHMFGLGLPQFFSLAVACGCDLMDSAAYILYAKEDRYFSLSTGTKRLDDLDEFPCCCPICSKFTPAEVKKLDEANKTRTLAQHNLYVSISELKTIRNAIKEGSMWELVEERVRSHPNLLIAERLVKDNASFLERFDSVYKKHGKLFSSIESLNRPLFFRYKEKLKYNVRIFKETKYLIILPALDTKSENSPSIKEWLENLKTNEFLPRETLYIVFLSDFYGIIPLELIDSYPIGQCEFIKSTNYIDTLYQISIEIAEEYIYSNLNLFEKVGAFIPETYINQFNEVVAFSKQSIISGLCERLKSKSNVNFYNDNNLNELLKKLAIS